MIKPNQKFSLYKEKPLFGHDFWRTEKNRYFPEESVCLNHFIYKFVVHSKNNKYQQEKRQQVV